MTASKRADELSLSDLGREVVVRTMLGDLRALLTSYRPDTAVLFEGYGVATVAIRSIDLELTASPVDQQIVTVASSTLIEFPGEETR